MLCYLYQCFGKIRNKSKSLKNKTKQNNNKTRTKQESKGAFGTCIVLMYQQWCTQCWAWLTERSPENEQKDVCHAKVLCMKISVSAFHIRGVGLFQLWQIQDESGAGLERTLGGACLAYWRYSANSCHRQMILYCVCVTNVCVYVCGHQTTFY